MAQTYLQIQKQIQALQREAEKLRTQEMSGVIDRIKVAIAEYGITAEQLGFGTGSNRAISKKTPAKAPSTGKAKYSNGQGQVWGGMGPRPAWLRAELDAGKSLEDFLVSKGPTKGTSASSKSQPAAATRPASAKTSKRTQKRRAKKQYADPASGKRWAGMGPQPKWLKDLVASGKSLEELTV